MGPSGQFPLFRLGTLLARQLSKPLADKIKEVAVERPWFRRAVCARTGRVFHVLQLRLRLWTLALRQPRELPPLSEKDALNAGADILGEVAVFALGGLIVIFEVNRQAEKLEDKLLEEESRRVALLLSLEELRRELALQQQDIERLRAALRHLAPRHFLHAPSPSSEESKPPTSSQKSTSPTPSQRSTSPTSSQQSTPPTSSELSTPPTSSELSTPQTSSQQPTPPTSLQQPTPPTSSQRSTSPTSSELSTPPTSEQSTPFMSDRPPPPLMPEIAPPPIPNCPPPSLPECPPPPMPECPPPVS